MSALTTTEALERAVYVEETCYTGFRRALGAWLVEPKTGATRFEIGEWADSPSACNPSTTDKVTFVGWIAGTDLNGTGPCGDEVAATAAEFAAFLTTDGFVTYGSDEAVAAAEAFKTLIGL